MSPEANCIISPVWRVCYIIIFKTCCVHKNVHTFFLTTQTSVVGNPLFWLSITWRKLPIFKLEMSPFKKSWLKSDISCIFNAVVWLENKPSVEPTNKELINNNGLLLSQQTWGVGVGGWGCLDFSFEKGLKCHTSHNSH